MSAGEGSSIRSVSRRLSISVYVHIAASILLVLAGSSSAQAPHREVQERLRGVKSSRLKRHAWADEIARSTDPAREISLLFVAIAPESTGSLDEPIIKNFKATVDSILFDGLREEERLGKWLRTILDSPSCTLSERISVAGVARNKFSCTPDLLPSLIDSYLIDHQPDNSSSGSFHETRVRQLRREIRAIIRVAGTQSIPFLDRFTESLTRSEAVAGAAEKALETLAKGPLRDPSGLHKKDREIVARAFRRAARQLEKMPKADESLAAIKEVLERLNPPPKILTMAGKYPMTAGIMVVALVLRVRSILGWPRLLAIEKMLSTFIPRGMDSLVDIVKTPALIVSLVFWLPFSLGFGWNRCLKAWRKKNNEILSKRAYEAADLSDDENRLDEELILKVSEALKDSKLDTVFECRDEATFKAAIKELTSKHQLSPVYVPGNVAQTDLPTKIREELRGCRPSLSDASVSKLMGKGMIFVAIGRATTRKPLSLKRADAHVKIAVTLGRSVETDRVIPLVNE